MILQQFKIHTHGKGSLIKSILSVIILSLAISMSSCKSETKKDAEKEKAQTAQTPVLTVTAINPSTKRLEKTLSVTGNLAAWDMVYVQAATNGLKVINIYADSGDFVSKGQILVQLDDSMIKAQLASAKAKLANSQAQLSKAKNPNRDQDVLRQRASLDQAKANLDNAKENAQRYESLHSQGAVSRFEADAKKTAFDTTQALYRQEEQRLSLILAGSRTEDVSIAQSSVADAQAQIQQLNVQLSQTVVRAPDGGMVFERQVHLGDVSSTMNRMFAVVRNNRFELQAKVPESDLRLINIGAPVSISSDVNIGLKSSGKVRQIGPGVDTTTRQAIVKVDVNYVKGMQTGQFLRGTVGLGSQESLVVPSKAIVNQEGIAKIFSVDNKSIANLKTIQTGIRNGDFVEVKAGLTKNDKIVIDGIGFLRDGDLVKVVKAEKKGGKV